MKRHLTPFTLVAGMAMLSFGVMVTFVLAVSQFEDNKAMQAIPVIAESVMPDGTVLALNAVTYGTHHQMDVLVNRRRFDPFESPWRWRRLDHHTSRDNVVVWMSRRDPTSGRFLEMDWWLRSEVTDSFGQKHVDREARWESVSSHGNSSSSGHRPFKRDTSSHGGSDRVLVVSSVLPKFRSSSLVDLDVFNAEGDKVATFQMPNTAPQPTTEWEPEQLPAARKDGEIEVVLNSVRSINQKAKRNGVEYVRARFEPKLEVRIDGESTKDWAVQMRGFEDILGNEGQSWDVQLSPKEPAWRVDVEAYRRDHAKFDASEIMTFEPVKLQGKGRFDLKQKSVANASTTADVQAVAGPGSVAYSLTAPNKHNTSYRGGHSVSVGEGKNRRSIECQINWRQRNGRATVEVESELPHVLLDVDSQVSNHRVTIRAVDDQGRPVKTHTRNHYNNARFCFLELEPDAREVQLEVIAHEPRRFEFFVKPPTPEWPPQRNPRGGRR